jgi:aspartyl-tRNA(Asn)/glutamyl-tRNA(Gln) amidotransferase subunit C
LSEIDTKGIEPTAQVTGLESVFREDKDPHKAGLYSDKLLEQTPDRKGDFVRVKGVMKDK